jgi:hypothetical protein
MSLRELISTFLAWWEGRKEGAAEARSAQATADAVAEAAARDREVDRHHAEIREGVDRATDLPIVVTDPAILAALSGLRRGG